MQSTNPSKTPVEKLTPEEPKAQAPVAKPEPIAPAVLVDRAPPTTEGDPPIKITDEAETVRLRKEEMDRRLAAERASTSQPDKGSEFQESLRPTTWTEFEKAVMKAREPPPTPVYNKPVPSERQQSQLDAEIEAGQRRQKFHEEHKRLADERIKAAAAAEESLTVVVPRKGEYQHETPTSDKTVK
jgi:hypothetical protein